MTKKEFEEYKAFYLRTCLNVVKLQLMKIDKLDKEINNNEKNRSICR